MPVTVIVGGQFGGEGKGKVAHFLAQETKASIAIRVGGPNSGHTVVDPSGNPIILQQLPTPAILPNMTCALGAGSYIDPDILLQEVSRFGLTSDRLFIDPSAMVISDREKSEEMKSSLREDIGSTLSGTGAAVCKRISRKSTVILAKNEKRLQRFIKPVVPILRNILTTGNRILIEGTQGFGLSLLHSDHYPYVTSRDTSAAAFVSEAGLSPLDVDDVVLVLRSFPIRVAGNSGPFPNEIDWETISSNLKSSKPIIEYTSVTKTKRRVARFDPDIVCKAIMVNRPSRIVLNHLDYIDTSCRHSNMLTDKAAEFLIKVETLIEKRIDYFGFGPASMVLNQKVRNLFYA